MEKAYLVSRCVLVRKPKDLSVWHSDSWLGQQPKVLEFDPMTSGRLFVNTRCSEDDPTAYSSICKSKTKAA